MSDAPNVKALFDHAPRPTQLFGPDSATLIHRSLASIKRDLRANRLDDAAWRIRLHNFYVRSYNQRSVNGR